MILRCIVFIIELGMIIDLTKIKRKDIDRLLLEKEMNIAAADALFNFSFYSSEESFSHDDYALVVKDYLELNLDNVEDRYFYESRIVPAIKELNIVDYKDNYYRTHIKPVPYKGKGYELTYLKYKPYQLFPYDDILVNQNFVEVSQNGYFPQELAYLAVLKDDIVWMSTDPNEINTMQPCIDEAKEHVLAFGLGLGYFPIMCATKPNVNKVTVVEKDPAIINIFKKHILPLFAFKEKIEIIQGDAFEYAKRDLKEYDYLFIDIWHNPEDGLPMYLKFKNVLKNKSIKTSYWLEKSILAMYRRCLLTIVEENLLGYTEKDYKITKNDYDKIINNLYFKTKNVVLSNYDELVEILQDKSLQNLV